MAQRPSWRGHLKLSLVTCPVALYAATSAASDVHFHLINPKTNNRIRMVTTDPDTGPIDRSDLVKGYEVTKGQYVLLDAEDLQSVKLESTKTIDIDRFVAEADIDRIYWDNPYYLAPDGKLADEAYEVIREAMAQSGQIALGRIVLSTRERLIALEPRGKGLLAYTLRTDAEVRADKDVFGDIKGTKPDSSMVAIARKIIEQKEGPFDPSTFNDRFEDALKALIAAKQKGQKPVAAEEPENSNVIDLMAALRASLGEKAEKQAGARKKAAAKPKSGSKPKSAPKAKTRKAG